MNPFEAALRNIGEAGFEPATARPPAAGHECPMRPFSLCVPRVPPIPRSGLIGHIGRCVRYQSGTATPQHVGGIGESPRNRTELALLSSRLRRQLGVCDEGARNRTPSYSARRLDDQRPSRQQATTRPVVLVPQPGREPIWFSGPVRSGFRLALCSRASAAGCSPASFA